MDKPNHEKSEHEKLDDVILTGCQTADEYLLDRALRYSDKNKKKLMQTRALRRGRRLQAVDEDERLSVSPPSGVAGPSRHDSGNPPLLEQQVTQQSSCSDEQEENNTQSNQTEGSGSMRSPEKWGFSPISQPTSPVAPPGNPPLNTCLLNNIPLMNILSLSEPREEPNTSSGTVPKKRTKNTFECNATPGSNAVAVPPTPRPLDLTCDRPINQRVEELLPSLTESEVFEINLNLRDVIPPSHRYSPITQTLPDLSKFILQGKGTNNSINIQHPSSQEQCHCSHNVAQNTIINARSTGQPVLRKRSESISNCELPPWKRYSRGLTNQTVGTQTLKRPGAESRIEILEEQRIPQGMSIISGTVRQQPMKLSCDPSLPTTESTLQRQMSGPDILLSNNSREDPCQKLCQKCLKDIDRPDSTFPVARNDQRLSQQNLDKSISIASNIENLNRPLQQPNLRLQALDIVPAESEPILNYGPIEQPFSNYTEEPMDIEPEPDPLVQYRLPMPVNKQVLPNRCLERSYSMFYNPEDVNQLRSTYRQENRKIVSVQTIETSKQTRPNIDRQGDNLRSTYMSRRQENRELVSIESERRPQSRPGMERSASMVFTPGQLSQTFSNRRGQILESPRETERVNQFRSAYPINRPNMGKFIPTEHVSPPNRPETRSMMRSASMVFKPGQMSCQPFSNYREPVQESSHAPDSLEKFRNRLLMNTQSVLQSNNLQRSASMVFTPGQFQDQTLNQINVEQPMPTFYQQNNISPGSQFQASYHNQNMERFSQDNTGSSGQFQRYPARNLERSASMMFIPSESQSSYAPTVPQPAPSRVTTAYPSSVPLNPTAVFNTGQMSQPNFVAPTSQGIRPASYDTGQMSQHNYMQNNVQQTGQAGFYNTAQLGQPSYQQMNNHQSAAPTPHYFTRQVRAALDAARPRYSEGSMSVPGQQYPPPTPYSAYSGAGAGYPEQGYNAGYGTPAMPPPPIYGCRHCNKTYKTNTGLKNHLRRICERNLYDRYEMR